MPGIVGKQFRNSLTLKKEKDIFYFPNAKKPFPNIKAPHFRSIGCGFQVVKVYLLRFVSGGIKNLSAESPYYGMRGVVYEKEVDFCDFYCYMLFDAMSWRVQSAYA